MRTLLDMLRLAFCARGLDAPAGADSEHQDIGKVPHTPLSVDGAAALPPCRAAAPDPCDSDAGIDSISPEEEAAIDRRVTEETRAFIAALPHTTGCDLAQWMAFIARWQATCERNGIIDMLRRKGFNFRWASVLESIYRNGGRPFRELPDHTPAVVVPATPSPSLRRVEDVPPARGGGELGRARPVKRVGTPELRAVSPLWHAPEAHAAHLVQHMHKHRAELPEIIFWERLRDIHVALCGELGWEVRPWNPVATALSRLIREPRAGRYQYVVDECGVTHRQRFYSVTLASAAAERVKPPTPSAPALPAAVRMCGRAAA